MPIATADRQIRVSDRVKKQLDRRRYEGECYVDVIERLLRGDAMADFYDGFGMRSDEEGDRIREKRAVVKEEPGSGASIRFRRGSSMRRFSSTTLLVLRPWRSIYHRNGGTDEL